MGKRNDKVLQLRFTGAEVHLYNELVRIAVQYREDGEDPRGAVHRLAKMILLDAVEKVIAKEAENEEKV